MAEVQELRKELYMTQQEFAKEYEIPIRTLQKWEQGVAKPAPYLIKLLKQNISLQEQNAKLEQQCKKAKRQIAQLKETV